MTPQVVREEILRLAARLDCDSAVLVEGMADALADVAAALDKHAGRQNLDDRLHAFCARVAETYVKVRNARETADAKRSV